MRYLKPINVSKPTNLFYQNCNMFMKCSCTNLALGFKINKLVELCQIMWSISPTPHKSVYKGRKFHCSVPVAFIDWGDHYVFTKGIMQGFPTCSPRATCGPLYKFLQPAKSYTFIGFSWINEIRTPECTDITTMITIFWFNKSAVVANMMGSYSYNSSENLWNSPNFASHGPLKTWLTVCGLRVI